jgi:DNA-binding transcriptional MocR family regulator
METNYPILPAQQILLAPVLRAVADNQVALHNALRDTSAVGTAFIRDAAAPALSRGSWQPPAKSLLFSGNGRQALAAVFSALVPIGERIGFESLTYPVAKAIAHRLGLIAVPLAMDSYGVTPDAIESANKAGPLRAIYLQPTIQNPLGMTMPISRRQDIATLLEKLHGPVAIEDSVYAFLERVQLPPLRALLPEYSILIDSLSKRIGPGLTLGFISAPDRLFPDIATAIASGAWAASGFAMEVGVRWLTDGTIIALEEAKRIDATLRQSLACRSLGGLTIRSNPAAYHLLLDFPETLRASDFVELAAQHGIAITPAAAFSVLPSHAPNFVRIGLANLEIEALEPALCTIAALLRGKERPVELGRTKSV